jgi:hypothetical protein
MKLLKGILTIALISVIAVSCKDAKKDVDAVVVDGVEAVADDAKDAPVANVDADAHKCSDAKCSADCTVKDCPKCAAKQAECKVKCAAKKAAADAEKVAGDVKDAVVDGADKVEEGAKKLGDAVKKVVK